jgi:hypothetical protein
MHGGFKNEGTNNKLTAKQIMTMTHGAGGCAGFNVTLFFTLLGFLCSYRGIYSIFPSNQFPFNNPL